MKKITSLLLLSIFAAISYAQILAPVKWSFEQEDLGNNEYNLVFKATIENGWYLYSQFNDPMGPVPTSFNFEEKNNVSLSGAVSENSPKVKEGYDEMFEMDIKKFGKEAVFKQKVKLNAATGLVKGYLEFMTCDDEQCLPPEMIDFEFVLAKKSTATEAVKENVKTETNKLTNKVENTLGNLKDETKDETKEEVSKLENKTAAASENIEKAVEEKSLEANQAILDPVKWTMSATKGAGNKVILNFNAKIQEKWGVYAQEPPKEDGPVPTTFTFEENENVFVSEGELTESSENVFEGYEPLFEMDIKKFKKEVSFIKEIELKKAEGTLKGYLEYMTCDDKQCLPPAYVDFELDLASLNTKIGAELNEAATENTDSKANGLVISTVDLNNPVSDCGVIASPEDDIQKKSFWLVFLMGLGGGFLALLTPCVFPMIPLTVSFFTKGSQGKKGLFNAFLYGFFIILVYVLLSAPFHVLEGLSPNILNDISTNVWLNIAFFAIFMFFAFSFFGYYEIELPSSFADKSSKAEGAGGVLGIFFMALTLAIVSFSCTGPILGVLMGSLATSGSAGAMNLTAGMAGFGVAFALPFTLFAAFPKLLNSMPSSGGWMNTVKVVLGFIEVALALKFLSNADLVQHWGVIKYEAFIGIWIITFIGLALYLFGKIKFPHDAPIKKLSKVRIVLGTLVLAFVGYLFTGFMYDANTKTYNSLDALSGFPPPEGYSWLYPIDCPQNFACFHDYDEALAYAKKVNKPLMVDFTGHACVNCRKVEKNVWSKPNIHSLIDDNYVLVSLYVDDKTMLPEAEQIEVEYNGSMKKLRTVGNKWAYFESKNFGQVSQPWYVLLSNNEELLTKPIGYAKGDVKVHQAFLECGIEANNSLK